MPDFSGIYPPDPRSIEISLLVAQKIENDPRMVAGRAVAESQGDAPVRPDDVGDAICDLACFVHTSIIGAGDVAGGVTKERVGEALLLGEGRVFFYAVAADTKNLDASRLKFVDSITEPDAFNRSATGVGLWVEPEDDGIVDVVAQTDLIAGVGLNSEIWGTVANCKHLSTSIP